MIPIPESSTRSLNSHFKDVSTKLEKRIKYVVNNGVVVASNTYRLTPAEKTFFNKLKKDESLKLLINSPINDLHRIIKIFRSRNPDVFDKSKRLNRILYGIFVNTEYKNLDKWRFIQRLKINSCPYCNRNYTYSLSKKAEIKPQLDHYFPKSIYPFFGVSFYNLIPSCQTCNGFGGKEEMDPIQEKMKSPYELAHDDFKFDYELIKLDESAPLEGDSKVKIMFTKKVKGNDKAFKLSKLYQKHEDHVLELIVKSKIEYSDDYRDYLETYDGLEFSSEEIDRMLMGNYTQLDDLHKRPLSKLYRDIGLELGLIKSRKT